MCSQNTVDFRLLRGASKCAWTCLAAFAAACGGTEDDPRAQPPGETEQRGLDLTSCEDIVDAFEFAAIESFEEGSVHDQGTTDPAGWWVSTDGTNPNFRPFDMTQVNTTCQVDPEQPNECRDLFPREGGAPSVWSGSGQCDPTNNAMQLVSESPGFSNWGFSFGANLHSPLNDGSEWDGVAFWAKHAGGSAVTSFLAALPDQYTTNQGSTYFCRDALRVENLCDPFGRGIEVDDEWRFYVLPFDDLYQAGFGKASPLGKLDVANILQLSFQLGAGTWDIWIDEVVYFRKL